MLSTYQKLVEKLIGHIVSLSHQRWESFCATDDMLAYFDLFVPIHIVIAAW